VEGSAGTDPPLIGGPVTDDHDAHLEEVFRLQFGSAGNVDIARAPGRINLIGEHLDYNGLAVMPMRIERGISLLFRPRDDDRVRLFNIDAVHVPIDYSLSDNRPSVRNGGWSDLVRAAGRSLSCRHKALRGLDGVIGGNLPIAAGLSSSTALVVAVARALMSVNGIEVNQLDLIEYLSQAERSVGAEGGAMDQAACVAGRPRHALKVEFDPLTLTAIHIPDSWHFVIAHSLVAADKKGSVEQACSARISECRQILEALQAAGVRGSRSYRGLLASYDHDELVGLSEHVLSPVLRRRYRHVITESRRVQQAESMLQKGNSVAFGRLMNESHGSLRDDFEVSHRRLDRLVELCVANGAVGARLTGAGFGGCVVALCDGSAAPVIDALGRDFYAADKLEEGGGRFLFRA
jgi:galactokinase